MSNPLAVSSMTSANAVVQKLALDQRKLTRIQDEPLCRNIRDSDKRSFPTTKRARRSARPLPLVNQVGGSWLRSTSTFVAVTVSPL